VSPPLRTGRANRRALSFAAVLALTVCALLATARPAHGQLPDAIPTWWHEAAGLTPLLTAPPPPNPATICLIDTGVTPTPDLDITARWAYDGGILDDVRATEDNPGHGTLVAHFAAGAVNGWGGAGAFPHARISSVRVFPKEGGASWREYIAAISRCLKLDANTKVIVISIGGHEIADREADELDAHIEQARNLYDANVVVAAGNSSGRVDFPARFPAAFSVTASGPLAQSCDFAPRGEGVDIAAPGCGLMQTDATGAEWTVDGTSFAAPLVAGALAALRSHTALTALEAEATLLLHSDGGRSRQLNAAVALRSAGLGTEPSGSVVAPAPVDSSSPKPVRTADTEPRSANSASSGLPRPRVQVRRVQRGVLIRARNRPKAAVFELRLGRRRLLHRSGAVRVRRGHGFSRCRFVNEMSSSPWTHVRW
jgi:subtilisin family serine protease